MQAPWYIVLAADLCNPEHILDRAELRLRRINVRQAIVIAPPLPDVHRQQRIRQAVSDHPLHSLGDLSIAAAPDIENKSPGFILESTCSLFIV